MISSASKRRLMTSAVAGMITLATYAVYAVTVVPFVEKQGPEARSDDGFTPRPSPEGSVIIDERFAQWFPDLDSWEHKNPLMIETPQAIVIFQKYQNIRGGTVRLTPCSVVMLSGDNQTDPQRQIKEAIVLQAPAGADLKFDSEFDIQQGKVGELIGGDLIGEVTIRGAGKKPTPDDDLFLSTRDISMRGDVISTAENVDFRWGENHGQGSDLRIALLPEDDGQRQASRFGGLATLELRRNVSLHLVLSDEEQAAEKAPEKAVLEPTPANSPDNPFPFTKDTPLDINCGGAFRFDFIALEASFNEGVIVERPLPDGRLDTLNCQRLLIGFQSMEDTPEAAKKAAANNRAFGRMEVKRLEAVGAPAILKAPSRDAYAEGNKLAYNFLTGGVNLESNTEVQFRQEGNELHARNLEYEPGENGRIGTFLAQGPGWLDWDMRDEKQREPRRFRAAWATRLHSRPVPDDDLQIISIEGAAVVNVTNMGRITADQIHAWLLEKMPAADALTPDGEAAKPELIPKRMLAVQMPAEGVNGGGAIANQNRRVDFQSQQLTGRAERLEAWFLDEAGSGNTGAIAAKADLRWLAPAQALASADTLGGGFNGGQLHFVGFRGDEFADRQPRGAVVRQVRFQSQDSQGARTANPLPWSSSRSSGGTSPAVGRPPERLAENTVSVNPRPWSLPPTAMTEQGGGAPLVPLRRPPNIPGAQPAPGAGANQGGSLWPQGNGQRRFDIEGKTIQVQLIQREKTAEVTEVTVRAAAVLRETQTEKPDDLPMLVRGEVLHVEDAHLPTSLVTVAGAPAHIEGRGLGLTANRINLDRGRNRLWIDEPGLMTLLVDRDMQGQKLREPVPLEITWRNRFEFDGLRAIFDRGVVARRDQEQLQTELLEVVMSELVDFGESTDVRKPRNERPEIAQVICREGVYLEAQRYDKYGELEAIEKMQMTDMAIDQTTGALSGGGPGWITRVGKSDARSDFALPGSVRPPLTGTTRRDEEPKILYLRVDFQQGMSGNIHRKQVIFQHQVVCVYGEIAAWDKIINGDRPSEFGPKTVRLRSDKLQITEMPPLNGAPAWRELVASGNTTSEGKMFTANAERITYTENQQILVLEGNSVRPAEFYLQRNVGDRPTRIAARKVKYNRKTGEYTLEGADSLDLTVPPKNSGGRGGR